MMRRALLIGGNWGLVHLGAYRQAGIEVVGLLGRPGESVARIAREQGIPHALTRGEEIAELAPDVISLATPAISHGDWLTRLADYPVICEKPLLGLTGTPAGLSAGRHPVWVNYAFAFLDSARLLADTLPTLGPVHRVNLACHYRLPLTFTPAQWWLEVASHPLSFLAHRLGEPRLTAVHSPYALSATLGGVPAELYCGPAEAPGLFQTLELHTQGGLLRLSGHYRPGETWRYAPLTLDGRPLNDGEWCAEDCWLRANRRSLLAILDELNRPAPLPQALGRGLFNPAKAWPLDALIQAAYGSSPSDQ